ncbi:hypothetical protein IEQ34_014689 [Dendrobium chrysotoxum]|uniref:Uncharacterized protein n=1 Tax=Dendrobium chrysotoxum TaxID=161865 RepID=A0AAV7GML3_DENCH|nr:hypothetical protein IEQ34_014689 [Dendrobium chrysotoxum]
MLRRQHQHKKKLFSFFKQNAHSLQSFLIIPPIEAKILIPLFFLPFFLCKSQFPASSHPLGFPSPLHLGLRASTFSKRIKPQHRLHVQFGEILQRKFSVSGMAVVPISALKRSW